jgi:hypothetical protein
MRAVPADLADRLESGAASLCHAWILTRADGVVLGFTDHDRDLVVEGVACKAASGWTAGAAETAAGFSPGLATAVGGFDDAALSEADLAAGLYDGARVECRLVDWSAPSLDLCGCGRPASRRPRPRAGPSPWPWRARWRRWTGWPAAPSAARATRRSATPAAASTSAAFPGATCDKRWATCRRPVRQRPELPRLPERAGRGLPDAVPVEGERNDGGRR